LRKSTNWRLKEELNCCYRNEEELREKLARAEAQKDTLTAELETLKKRENHSWDMLGANLPRIIPNKLPALQSVIETVRNMVSMLEAHRESILMKMIADEHQKKVCSLCFDRLRDETLIPCGHTFCSVCAKRVYAQNDQLCPYCRHSIQRTQKVFM